MIDAFDDRLYFGEKPIAGFRQRDAARSAIEQPDPEPLFERPDGLTHRRQGDPNPDGRLREAELLRDGYKGC